MRVRAEIYFGHIIKVVVIYGLLHYFF